MLRQYEGQETHTLHLVCSPKYTKNLVNETNQKNQVSDGTSNINTTNVSQPQGSNSGQSSQGIPQQNLAPPNVNWENLNGPFNVVDPNQYVAQLAWMQQAYFQYITQYMHL